MKFSSESMARVKKHIRHTQRRILDRFSGARRHFAEKKIKTSDLADFQHFNFLKQPFLPTSTLENKRHNLRLAVACLDRCLIQPGEIFSFWHLVGYPGARRGYKPGRNIVGGRLSTETGGGLCQLSSILYHSALLYGLDIIERHPHSYDLYWDNESQRYTPPGTDATVVFGYKDLRFRNSLPTAVVLQFEVAENDLSCMFFSKQEIQKLDLQAFIQDHETNRIVELAGFLKNAQCWKVKSEYRKMTAGANSEAG
jgi:vancomycin resistance protein VanW